MQTFGRCSSGHVCVHMRPISVRLRLIPYTHTHPIAPASVPIPYNNSLLLGKHCTIVIMPVDYQVCFRMCIENKTQLLTAQTFFFCTICLSDNQTKELSPAQRLAVLNWAQWAIWLALYKLPYAHNLDWREVSVQRKKRQLQVSGCRQSVGSRRRISDGQRGPSAAFAVEHFSSSDENPRSS